MGEHGERLYAKVLWLQYVVDSADMFGEHSAGS